MTITGCHYRSGIAFHHRVATSARSCRCLRCNRTWLSPDPRRYRICPNCSYSEARDMIEGRVYADPRKIPKKA